MKRDDEIATIERWIDEYGVRHDRPAYAAPTAQGALNRAEEAARIAAVRIEPSRRWEDLRALWDEQRLRRRAAVAAKRREEV
ncbi:MAG TPA: hypothetical protein VJ770_12245 [Stellaceae bacterium]|nr:hypothetical protein [Stellaceae bacterium]